MCAGLRWGHACSAGGSDDCQKKWVVECGYSMVGFEPSYKGSGSERDCNGLGLDIPGLMTLTT
jgi:hypothetical protein